MKGVTVYIPFGDLEVEKRIREWQSLSESRAEPENVRRLPAAPNGPLSLRGEGLEEILQRQQSIQRRREVVSAGHRFGKTQHRIALTVGIAEHAQQLLFNIVQTRAVGAK